MADILASYNQAVIFGPTPTDRSLTSLQAWIVGKAGPSLTDLLAQAAWIAAYVPPVPPDPGGGGA